MKNINKISIFCFISSIFNILYFVFIIIKRRCKSFCRVKNQIMIEIAILIFTNHAIYDNIST